jgi:inorganic pyrophosphatase
MYRPRLYGGDIPEKTINKIKQIQLWWRNLKIKKKVKVKRSKSLKKSLKGYEMITFSHMKKNRKKVKPRKKLIWY